MIFFLLFYSISFMYVSTFIVVSLNKKLILINKLNKQNQVDVSSYKIKYLDLHLFIFLVLLLVIIKIFFLHLFTHVIIDLFNYMLA